ncbi:transcription cofactor vestigial-like protein 4 [Chanos chanos]|uniref:Transcription cofactor vestigial-like protein 4 n=1 Tax=Chanos chanos TaxID=29144 RepID=A0A6J2V1B7_CHACN|nr:transcription cofactor vestigial-like protein 4 [Chanos chanos]
MLLTRMDLLSLRFMDKMNNNIGRLHYDAAHYEDESGLSGDSRIHGLASAMGSPRTGPPPISPSKRKYLGEQVEDRNDFEKDPVSKMSRLFAAQLGQSSNGDGRPLPWSHCQNSFQHASSAINGLHANHVYAPLPVFVMDQPLALTKNSNDTARTSALSAASATERQQNRPSVITCAPASNRTCNLSNCHMSPSGCSTSNANARSKTNANSVCDPVIEEHFRRSLGKIYQEPEPISNSVSITGSVDDHFAKALGETWLQIKAKGSGPRSPESSS